MTRLTAPALVLMLSLSACGESDNPVSSTEEPAVDHLGLLRPDWTPASPPLAAGEQGLASRGRLTWYNPFDRVLRTEIWPDEEVPPRNSRIDVLVLELRATSSSSATWGGVMTVLPDSARDISRATHMRVWLRGAAGTLRIDIGAVSEDWNGDGLLNTEDLPLPGRSSGDGLLSATEDVGLDGRSDAEELAYYLGLADIEVSALSEDQRRTAFLARYPDRDPEDPEGDNWAFDVARRDDYTRINGTEGNRLSSDGQAPDTEDLNGNGVLDTRNDYYRHTIDLRTTRYEAGTESHGWRLYRLSLFGPGGERVGVPDSTAVEFVRLVLESPGGRDALARVEIAAISIPGAKLR